MVDAYRNIYLQLGSRPLDRPRSFSVIVSLGEKAIEINICRAGYDAAQARENRGGPPLGLIHCIGTNKKS